jgi:DNA-binding MarR family transcriptional regulator
MTDNQLGRSGYWYDRADDTTAAVTSVDVLNLFRQYRAAETQMRRDTRDSMGMGETDLLALRYLLRAAKAGETMTPGKLAQLLKISTASTTILLDRLEKSGHVRRAPHPTDRRSSIVTATDGSDDEVRATLGRMHQNMVAAADSLSADEIRTISQFLQRMIFAVESAHDHTATDAEATPGTAGTAAGAAPAAPVTPRGAAAV